MGKDLESSKKQLFTFAMKGKWEDVIELYKKEPRLHKARITRSGSTALHVAVFDGNEEVVEQMVKLAETCPIHCKEALETQNDRKNTALHVAASMGNLRICHLIAQKHPSLVNVRNVDGETPLFLAVLHGRKEAFLCLHYLSHPNGSSPNYVNCRRNDGDTILHCAIAGNFYDLAFQIIHLYEDLVNLVNEEGLSALHLLAAKPSDFKSGSRLGRYEMIIYHCIFVEELKQAENHHQQSFSEEGRNPNCNIPDNYRTCCDFFGIVKTSLTVVTNKFPVFHFLKDKFFSKGQPSNAGDPEAARNNNIQDRRTHHHTRQLYPENYEPCCKFFRFVYLVVTVILGQGSSGLKRIRRKREKHVWSLQIMNELLCRASLYEYENNGSEPQVDDFAPDNDHKKDEIASLAQDSKIIRPGNDKHQQHEGGEDSKKKRTETPILIAAKNGVTEMVEKIIELFPVAIHDMNEEKKNVVLLAVEHRPHVYQLLLQRNILKESAFRKVDHKGNSALHLAAKFGQYKPWLIPGAALQMQWEIKWFEFVKESMPSHLFVRRNNRNKTPKDIFTETHAQLVKSGGDWLNKTSESCSVVAALIATVAFATSATLPGGVDQETGHPTLEREPAFNVFAISSLIALCCSITAVVMFLSILTSRYQEYDFRVNLPMKLILGLTSLFMSIASMLVSFCAGHFFVLRDQLQYAALPIYAVTCLPVTLFALAQFPLYFDLVWATLKSVPQRSYKAIPIKFSGEDSTQKSEVPSGERKRENSRTPRSPAD
ncbi:ankyrin repeat-containing protein NPR4-like isoform X2 [Prosopis cineraria]|uniref:ankyrin repeat-containing protein NPR4-like isoform X2 n=1 Tax=Prosopis cineraria TaxID=364024 RepID=UPI00240FC7F8|nr:ankyrin repeat-containing protein NPR4-like isoform X2 [Prosopis cineraria]